MKKPIQLNSRFLLSHPAHFIALGFGSGLSPVAPGTAGSAAAILLYGLLSIFISPIMIVIVASAFFLIGIPICRYTGIALGKADHGAIVWDEIVAMLFLLALVPASLLGWLLAFVLFRLFDIWKPWPIRWVEARVQGGLGVMLDDILAVIPSAPLVWLIHNSLN